MLAFFRANWKQIYLHDFPALHIQELGWCPIMRLDVYVHWPSCQTGITFEHNEREILSFNYKINFQFYSEFCQVRRNKFRFLLAVNLFFFLHFFFSFAKLQQPPTRFIILWCSLWGSQTACWLSPSQNHQLCF